MLQAPVLIGLWFDPFPFQQDGLAAPEVDIGGREVTQSIYRKIKNSFFVISTLCQGTLSPWSTVYGGRLGNPIGVPAVLIGECGEASLVIGAGPDCGPRCQIRQAPRRTVCDRYRLSVIQRRVVGSNRPTQCILSALSE